MAAMIIWKCQCGCHVKAAYQPSGMSYVGCPRPPCTIKHIIDGKVTSLWMQYGDADERWEQLPVEPYLGNVRSTDNIERIWLVMKDQAAHVDEKRMLALSHL